MSILKQSLQKFCIVVSLFLSYMNALEFVFNLLYVCISGLLEHEGEGESVSLQDNQIESVVDSVFDYDVNADGMIDYREFMMAQNLAQKKEEKKKCATCRD